MKHVIIRSIIGLIWIAAGIIGLATGKGDGIVLSLVFGAAFCISAFSMWKKNHKSKSEDKQN